MSTLTFETMPLDELVKRGIIETPQPESLFPRDAEPTTVLVVDDERLIADTLVIILNQSGFCATAVYCGEAALEAFETSKFDLLISDVKMPGMNGVELAIEVQSSWPDCRILLFSGNAGTSDLLASARERGFEFPLLSKPAHPRELLQLLADWGLPDRKNLPKAA